MKPILNLFVTAWCLLGMRIYLSIIFSVVFSVQAQITPPDNAVFAKDPVLIIPVCKHKCKDLIFKLDASSLKLSESITDTADFTFEVSTMKALLFNRTDSNIFISQWPELTIIAEAKDSGSTWRPIELYTDRFRCSVGAKEKIKLRRQYKLPLAVFFLTGEFKTKVRLKARVNNETIITSNEVDVMLHPGLFSMNRNNFTGKFYECEDRFMD